VSEQATDAPPRTTSVVAFTALALAGCLWGTGFLFGKIALAELGVGHMVLYRFLFASLALLPLAVRYRVPIRRADLRYFAIASALGVPVQFLVQFEGLARTTVSHASLVVGTAPILLAVGAVLFAGERMDGKGWLVLAASTAGAALIVLGAPPGDGAAASSGPTLAGDGLVLASLVAAVVWMLLSRSLMRPESGYPPVVVSTYVLCLGTALLLPWVLAVDGPIPTALSTTVWLALAAQGLLATALTTLLWNWGLARVPSSRAGVFLNLEPVVGAILGVVILHEVLGPLAIVGGVLIVGAAVVLTWPDNGTGGTDQR
jgi:drug/metabolite transporter (DMT)-like permease